MKDIDDLLIDPTTSFMTLDRKPFNEDGKEVYYDVVTFPNGKKVVGRVESLLSREAVAELIEKQWKFEGIDVSVELFDKAPSDGE